MSAARAAGRPDQHQIQCGSLEPSDLIRRAREAGGLSQAQLAFRAGTSQQAISRLERGDEDPTWGRLRMLLLALGMRPTLDAEPLGHDLDPRDLEYARELGLDDRLEGAAIAIEAAQELRASVGECES